MVCPLAWRKPTRRVTPRPWRIAAAALVIVTMAGKAMKSPKAPASKKAKVEKKDAKPEAEIKLDPPELDENADEESSDGEGDLEAEALAAPKGKAAKTKANRLSEMGAKEPKGSGEPRGVVYLGHLPKGFYEPQMKTFFSQFGPVTRIRLSRSKRNAASKGYAFVEFEEESVAKIVADTMHKYLLFEKQLVCHIVPPEKQHASMFKNWQHGLKNWTNQRRKKALGAHNDRPKVEVDGEEMPQATVRQAARRNAKEKRLQQMLTSLGIKFDVGEASVGQKRVRAGKESKKVKGKKTKGDGKAAPKSLPKSPKAAPTPPKASPKLAPKTSPKTSPKASPKAAPAAPAAPKKKAIAKRKATAMKA